MAALGDLVLHPDVLHQDGRTFVLVDGEVVGELVVNEDPLLGAQPGRATGEEGILDVETVLKAFGLEDLAHLFEGR